MSLSAAALNTSFTRATAFSRERGSRSTPLWFFSPIYTDEGGGRGEGGGGEGGGEGRGERGEGREGERGEGWEGERGEGGGVGNIHNKQHRVYHRCLGCI